MKNRNGFTLLELLAVIAILGIILLIAVPNIIKVYYNAQKETFVSNTKMVFAEAEKKFVNDSANGIYNKVINSENEDTKLDLSGEELKYCIVLNDDGNVVDLKVSNGKWVAKYNGTKSIKELSIDDLEEGNLDDYDCQDEQKEKPTIEPTEVDCTFNGSMVQGAEYVNGQYTYRYMQEFAMDITESRIRDTDMADEMVNSESRIRDTDMSDGVMQQSTGYRINRSGYKINRAEGASGSSNSTVTITINGTRWNDITDAGWGVVLTDKDSTDPVTSKVCTTINNKPVISMSFMFATSKASTIDFSSFDTKRVKNMAYMFGYTSTNVLNLNKFDISNVNDMTGMFRLTNAVFGFAKDNMTASYFNDANTTDIPNTLTFVVR